MIGEVRQYLERVVEHAHDEVEYYSDEASEDDELNYLKCEYVRVVDDDLRELEFEYYNTRVRVQIPELQLRLLIEAIESDDQEFGQDPPPVAAGRLISIYIDELFGTKTRDSMLDTYVLDWNRNGFEPARP